MHVKYFPQVYTNKETGDISAKLDLGDASKGQARETEWGRHGKAAEKAGSGQERASPTPSIKPISSQIYIQKRGMSF